MKRIELTEWKINVEELPNKEARERHSNIWHYVIELENIDYGFLFYNVTEFRMGWYYAAFAILKNKAIPIKIFDSQGLAFSKTFGTDFYYADKSKMIQLVKECWNPDKNISEHTFCLLDFHANLFSIVSFDCSDFYCLKELEERKFIIELDKGEALNRYIKREQIVIDYFMDETVSCDSLLWINTNQITNYNTIYWANRERFRKEL